MSSRCKLVQSHTLVGTERVTVRILDFHVCPSASSNVAYTTASLPRACIVFVIEVVHFRVSLVVLFVCRTEAPLPTTQDFLWGPQVLLRDVEGLLFFFFSFTFLFPFLFPFPFPPSLSFSCLYSCVPPHASLMSIWPLELTPRVTRRLPCHHVVSRSWECPAFQVL